METADGGRQRTVKWEMSDGMLPKGKTPEGSRKTRRGHAMLIEAMKGQFDAAFHILDDAIMSFAPQQWKQGSPPFNGPARVVLHMLQCAEFYTSGDKAGFKGRPKPVHQMTDEEVPSQQQMLEYSSQARSKTISWIDSIGDAGLTAPNPVLLKAGFKLDVNNMELIAYALRHLQHHIGELCAYQKQAGLEPAEWKSGLRPTEQN